LSKTSTAQSTNNRTLTIAQDIRQAALDGTLQTWGKAGLIGMPLVKIPPGHRKDFRLYWEQCFVAADRKLTHL
jgi:hypothetical protein